MKKFYEILSDKYYLLMMLFALIMGASDVYAEGYNEDFSSITGTEDNLYSVPEGWDVIGTLRNFSLSKRYCKTSSPSLCYTSGGNTSDYLVTPKVSGTVTFWYYGTNSRTKGSMKIYECLDDNGTLSVGDQLGEDYTVACQKWAQFSVNLASPKRLAILMSRTAIDDFSAESLGGEEGGDNPQPVFIENKALQLLSFEMNNEYEQTADEKNEFSVSFTVRVKNTSNVMLGADEVSVSLTNQDGSTVYATQTATGFDSLAIDGEISITLTATIPAGESEYWAFYARENVTGTFMLNNWGNHMYNNVHVKPYYAKFGIKGPDGYALFADELIDFGYSNTEASRQIVLTNEGTAPLAVSNITLPSGFTASENAFEVAAGGQKTVTLTLTPEEGNYGSKGGDVTIEHALGTFTFKVSGTTVDPEKFFVNFEDGKLPEAWQAEDGWSVTTASGNHYAQQNSIAAPTGIITQKLAVAQGEKLTFQAKRAFANKAAMLIIYYSATGKDDSWQVAKGYEDLTSAFETCTLGNLKAGSYYFRFFGQYVAIDNIIGFKEATDQPQLAVLNAAEQAVATESAANFGIATKDSTQTYYIKNVGTGILNATLSTKGTGFIVTPTTVELGAGEQQAVTITMAAQPWGEKKDTLVVESEGLDPFRLALAGESRDPEVLFVDFQDQQLPRGWETSGKWSVTWESFGGENYWAEAIDYTNALSMMNTAKILVKEGDMLTFDAKAYESYVPRLRVSYSADRTTWTQATDLTSRLTTEGMTALQVTGLPTGEWFVRFEGSNVIIDNITGIHLTEAPEHMVVLTAFEAPNTCEVNESMLIMARAKNLWADREEVTATLLIDGEQQGDNMVKSLSRNVETNFAFFFTPTKAAEAMKAQVVLTYAGGTLQTDVRTFEVTDSTLADTTVVDTTIIDTTIIDTTVVDTVLVDTTIIDTTHTEPVVAIQPIPSSAMPGRGARYHDLQGRPSARKPKGALYIRNGRKYLNKQK